MRSCSRQGARRAASRCCAPASPAADIEGGVNVLVQLSQIVADHAEITEIDINPLLCDATGRDRSRLSHPCAPDHCIRAIASGYPAQSAKFRGRESHARRTVL